MNSFTYTANPTRVVFGAGSLQQVGAEVDRLGARRALVLSTPEQADTARRVAELLGERAAGVFAKAVMHVPIETARHGAPASLRALGMPADGVERAAELAVMNQYPNPRPLERAALRRLLQRAFDGAAPSAWAPTRSAPIQDRMNRE